MNLAIRILVLILLSTGTISGSSFVSAQSELFPEEICVPGDGNTENSAVCDEAQKQIASNQDPVSGQGGIISDAVNIIAIIAGAAAVIIIIYSGFVFVTAGGSIGGQRAGDNPNRAKKARSSLLGAVVGLIVIASAWAVTRFVIDKIL